jgi:hypothetical protein
LGYRPCGSDYDLVAVHPGQIFGILVREYGNATGFNSLYKIIKEKFSEGSLLRSLPLALLSVRYQLTIYQLAANLSNSTMGSHKMIHTNFSLYIGRRI